MCLFNLCRYLISNVGSVCDLLLKFFFLFSIKISHLFYLWLLNCDCQKIIIPSKFKHCLLWGSVFDGFCLQFVFQSERHWTVCWKCEVFTKWKRDEDSVCQIISLPFCIVWRNLSAFQRNVRWVINSTAIPCFCFMLTNFVSWHCLPLVMILTNKCLIFNILILAYWNLHVNLCTKLNLLVYLCIYIYIYCYLPWLFVILACCIPWSGCFHFVFWCLWWPWR